MSDMHRWVYELIVHKGFVPSEGIMQKFGVPRKDGAFSLEDTQKIHDELGCLMTRDSKIDYWRKELIRIKNDPDTTPSDITHVMGILNKYLRGVYQ